MPKNPPGALRMPPWCSLMPPDAFRMLPRWPQSDPEVTPNDYLRPTWGQLGANLASLGPLEPNLCHLGAQEAPKGADPVFAVTHREPFWAQDGSQKRSTFYIKVDMQKSSILTPTWPQHGSQKNAKMRPKRPLQHAPEALDERSLYFRKSFKTIGGSSKNGPPASPRTTDKRLQDASRRLKNQHRMNVQVGSGLGTDLDPFGAHVGTILGPCWVIKCVQKNASKKVPRQSQTSNY